MSIPNQPARRNEGPSPALVAWRCFIVETMICIEIVVLIAVISLGASHDAVAAVGVGALVTAVLRILWRRPP